MVRPPALQRDAACRFIETILAEASTAGLSTQGLIVDHVCFRTASLHEYQDCVAKMRRGDLADLRGELLAETPVNGRPIATFRLDQPLAVGPHLVEAIEIPAPKPQVAYASGFEHVEIVIAEAFAAFARNHPGLDVALPASHASLNPEATIRLKSGQLKLHHLPLSCVIAIEETKDVWDLLQQTRLWERLAPWSPLPSGSLPLGIGLAGSDFDILLHAPDLDACEAGVRQHFSSLGIELAWHRSLSANGPCRTARFSWGQALIELFISTTPVLLQNAHRHLRNEYKMLMRHGAPFKMRIMSLKRQGMSTEEAFAKALGLVGDPYEAMLGDLDAMVTTLWQG